MMTLSRLNKLFEKYYRIQNYIDIGWAEFSWFSDSLVELMAILYLLNYMGITVSGHFVYVVLIGAFIVFYNFGKFLKKKGIYDTSEYVGADIDPVTKEILEAARLIKKHYSSKAP